MIEDPFKKLREQLELLEWPNVYFFKFIVPNEPQLLALATALFNETAEITFHESKTGKYISIGAKEMMLDVDSIIIIYQKAALIKGIISL
jgi:putative lipoic acid-binding regulatory protein